MTPEDTNTDLASHLATALADVVVMYFQVHGAHWNVKGPDFAEYHEFFESIYEDVYSSIDPIAENIRKLGHPRAPSTLEEFLAWRTFGDVRSSNDSTSTLTADLLTSNTQVLSTLQAAFASAESVNEQGIMNFLAERIDMHQKWGWQLRASLG